MMHIFLNGLGASAGAGLTYLYNVVPRMAALPGLHATVAVQQHLAEPFAALPNVTVIDAPIPSGTLQRFWFEQTKLPRLIRLSGADVLLSAGNFAIRNSPVPQILLSGNSLYTSADFFCDLHRRREYRLWLDTKIRGYLAKRSVLWADRTVAPSCAFANELCRWTGKPVDAVHHGFDANVFFGDSSPATEDVQSKLKGAQGYLKVLFVSHYNYYRNFETLFQAVAILKQRFPAHKVRLFLTCTFDDAKTPGPYRTAAAKREIRQLGVGNVIVELGAVPYRQLHHVYRACDLYVTPAYAETFAHPLVEAMASGLPIVASDIPVHREVCGGAALYFPKFSPEVLAESIVNAAQRRSPAVPTSAVLERFSWAKHLEAILTLAQSLSGKEVDNAPAAAQSALRSAQVDAVGNILQEGEQLAHSPQTM